MGCGERFDNLLTSADGEVSMTAPCSSPFGLCSDFDYDRALERAKYTASLILKAWNTLIAIENHLQRWPLSESVRSEYNNWLARLDDLPSLAQMLLVNMQVKVHIDKAWLVVADGRCLLQQLVEAVESYGEKANIPDLPSAPPPPPSLEDTLASGLKLLLGVGAVGLGFYIALNLRKGKES